jgi:hypothetical protein
MRDSDFQEVWGTITSALGKFGKLAYSLNPHATPENIEFWQERGVQVIKTFDLQFVRYLREKLEQEDLIPSHKFLNGLRTQRNRILSIHVKLRQNSDGGLASSMYQDGLLHGLGDILSSTALGIKQNQDFDTELTYAAKAIREAIEANDPIEIAYWNGRHEALKYFCSRDTSAIPTYFHPQKMNPISKFVKGRQWT